MSRLLLLAAAAVVLGGLWQYVKHDLGRLDRLEAIDRPENRSSLILRNGASSAVKLHVRCSYSDNPNELVTTDQVLTLAPGETDSVLLATPRELKRTPGAIANQFCFVIGQSLFGIRKKVWQYRWSYGAPPLASFQYEARWFRGSKIPYP